VGWGLKLPLFWTPAVRRGPFPFLPAVKRASQLVLQWATRSLSFCPSRNLMKPPPSESKNAAVEEAGTDVRVAIHSHLGMASWGNATAYIGRVCPESCRLVRNMVWLAGVVAGALRRPRVHLDGTMQLWESSGENDDLPGVSNCLTSLLLGKA
jgi:hypothetical protein